MDKIEQAEEQIKLGLHLSAILKPTPKQLKFAGNLL
jgi:hypothetical protein